MLLPFPYSLSLNDNIFYQTKKKSSKHIHPSIIKMEFFIFINNLSQFFFYFLSQHRLYMLWRHRNKKNIEEVNEKWHLVNIIILFCLLIERANIAYIEGNNKYTIKKVIGLDRVEQKKKQKRNNCYAGFVLCCWVV